MMMMIFKSRFKAFSYYSMEEFSIPKTWNPVFRYTKSSLTSVQSALLQIVQTFKVRFSGSIMEWVVSGSRFRWAQGWLFLVICDRNHVKKVKCAKLEFMSSLLGLKILSCEAEFSCLSLVDLVWTGGVRKKSTAKKVSIFFLFLRWSISALCPTHIHGQWDITSE